MAASAYGTERAEPRRCVHAQSSSTAVVYECAVTLVGLSSAPTAVRAAANCYCQLLVSQSDNNVKLIVLDRLVELKTKHREVKTCHADTRRPCKTLRARRRARVRAPGARICCRSLVKARRSARLAGDVQQACHTPQKFVVCVPRR